MMSFNMRVKSAALAFAIAASTSNSFCEEQSAVNTLKSIPSVVAAHKEVILFTVAALLIALKIRLDTKPRCHYDYENISQDLKNLLGAYNILDAQSRAVISNFIDKYFVGAKLKLDDSTIRIKEEDGSVVTTKRKKLTQKPSGAMGLFDAYILQQMKPNAELLPSAATFYVMATMPWVAWAKEYNKATKVD